MTDKSENKIITRTFVKNENIDDDKLVVCSTTTGDFMRLKENLQAHLKSKGLTASALARLAGVPKTSLAEWLKGRTPNIAQLKKVATVLGTTVDHLCFGDGAHKSDEIDLDELLSDKPLVGSFKIRIERIRKNKPE